MKLNRSRASIVALALTATFALSACAAGGDTGSADGQTFTEADIQAALQEETTITYWQWTPGIEKQAEMFQELYPAITVKVENVGQGPDQYSKLRTALTAGSGAPDLAMIEYQFLDSFAIDGSLVDLTPFGVDELKGDYPEWLWSQVDRATGVYGFPSNAGPMGNLYRQDVYEAAGITNPPTTWDEFRTAAAAIRETGSYIMTLPGSNPGHMVGLFWQAGAHPFSYDGGETVGINIDSPEAQEVADYWQGMLDDDLVDNENDFTDSWFQGLANGKYASWLTAAWGPVFLDSGIVANTSGQWRAAGLPQWDPANPSSSSWGGNATSVVKGSKNPLVAYAFARFLNNDPAATEVLALEQSQYPATIAMAESPAFADQQVAFFGNQEVNKVFIESSSLVDTDFQWLPIMEYVFQSYSETLGQAIADDTDLRAGLTAWQEDVAAYAEAQGFTVE